MSDPRSFLADAKVTVLDVLPSGSNLFRFVKSQLKDAVLKIIPGDGFEWYFQELYS
jgi:hypothetical protein